MKWQYITVLSLLLLLTTTLVSCGATQQPSAAATDGLVIELTTKPDPPVAGQVELIVTLKDAAQQAVDGAAVNILASHSSMANYVDAKAGSHCRQRPLQYTFRFQPGEQGRLERYGGGAQRTAEDAS